MQRFLIIILILFLATSAGAVQKAYMKTALTGGGATALDGINGSSLTDGDFAFVLAGGVSYTYLLDADSGATPSSPTVISPTANAGDKRWILQNSYGTGSMATDVLWDAAGDLAVGTGSNTATRLAKGENNSLLGVNVDGTLAYYSSLSLYISVVPKTDNGNISAAEMVGSFITISGAYTMTLPAVSTGSSACFYATSGATFVLHPNAADHFILDGVAKSAHANISSPATAGSFVCIIGTAANTWTTTHMKGTFTSP